jgi:hypothetical protein
MARFKSIASITAQNNFSAPVLERQGLISLSISGTWVATVTLQRSFDGTNWFDIDSWTSNIETFFTEPSAEVQTRLGVKTGDFTSGTVAVRLSQ